VTDERGGMTISRRDLLKAGVGAAALVAMPRPLVAYFGGRPEPVPPIRDVRIKELAFRAIEAAQDAGAAYADVRLTHKRRRVVDQNVFNTLDREELAAGVRVLVDGYWGFASSPVWSPEEMVRLGREAVEHAKANALGVTRAVELAARPVVVDEHWRTPVEIDPFSVSPYEIADHLRGLQVFISRHGRFTAGETRYTMELKAQAFACSDGAYVTQELIGSEGLLVLSYRPRAGEEVRWPLDGLGRAGVGWELFKGQPIRERIERLMEEMKEHAALPAKAVEVGRYQVVCDAEAVARLIDATLAAATELDRAFGYEADAGGTTYVTDPLGMVGALQVASPMLTLSANRSEPGGAATVGWDDEGVRPEEVTLVREGVLVDFQTTRESATWLADYYGRNGRPVASRGCAWAESGIHAPLQRRPNLVVSPGPGDLDFEGAVAGVGNGIAVRGLEIDVDFQGLNGIGFGDRVYEVKNGTRVARILGAGFLFRAPELWKGLVALGGARSSERFGMESVKGQPEQRAGHSVTAPVAVFEQFTVVDALRKA